MSIATRGCFWAVIGVALLARLLVFSVNVRRDEPRFLLPDSHSYIATATGILRHGAILDEAGKPDWGRVPLYPLVLALVFATGAAAPGQIAGAVLVQCLLGTAVVAVAARSARCLPGSPGVAPVGLMLALEPSVLAYSSVILSEMLYALVLLLAFVAWERHLRLRDTATLLWLAAALGALPLIRPIGLFFSLAVLPVLIWAWRGRTGMLRAIGIFLLVTTLPAVAWSWRNHALLGSFSLHSTGPWAQAIFAHDVEMSAGRTAPPRVDGLVEPWEAGFGTDQGLTLPETSAKRLAYFREIVGAHPGLAAREWAINGTFLIGVPDSLLARILLEHPPAVPEGSVRERLRWLGDLGPLAALVVAGMLISLGGILAIPCLLASWRRWNPGVQGAVAFVIMAVLYHWAVSSFVGHQGERYRVPVIPFLALLLSSGLGSGLAAGRRASSGATALGAISG